MTKDKEKTLTENIGLAYFVAKKFYTGNAFNDDDIRQVALIGLWKAIDTWEETKGALSTYATKVITNYILQELRKKGRKKNNALSYDALISSCDGEVSYLETVASEKNDIEFVEVLNDFQRLYVSLNKKEQALLYIYSNYPEMRQEDIATSLGVTQSRISKMKKKIQKNLSMN